LTGSAHGKRAGDPGMDPDVELVERVLAREPAAIEALADRMARIPSFLSAINSRRGSLLSRHDLDDLAQDVVIRVWNKLEHFHGRGSLDSWMYRFALLEFMNELRKKSRAPRAAPGPPQLEQLEQPDRPTPPGLDELVQHLASLPDEEAEVIEMHHFDGARFAAIGEALGIPRGTAKTRYYRGLTRLREKLERSVPEEWT